MTISSIGRRVALVGSLAMLVALLPLAASAQPAGPVLRDLQVNDELDASESVQASVLWSQETFADDSADEVLIATDQDFADALASGVLQGDAPLLYTDGDTLDDLVLEEIARVGATSATILGGEVAVSPDVEAALSDEGLEVSRLEGESRIETAVAIAEQELEGDTVFIARAFGTDTDATAAFADNLALGGWAAASGTPVLLTQTDVLTGNTRAFLEANTDVTTAIVIGGEVAVSEDVVGELEELGLTVERVAGENRFGTAVAIAEARGLDAADVDQAVFVEGQADDAYVNGLAAAAYSAANDAPILLVNGDTVPPETQDYLGDEADFSITDDPDATAGVLGTNVDAAAAQALADALNAELEIVTLPTPGEPGGNASFTVTPEDEVTNTVSADAADSSGARQYTADVGDAESVDIALFPAENVSVDEDGIVTIDPNTQIADANGVSIEVVNGVANVAAAAGAGDAHVNDVAPNNGTVTFTVDSVVADEVVPVVWADEDGDNVLDLDAETDQPTEAFGVGGQTNWIPAEAAGGPFNVTAPDISAVNKDADYFIGDPGTGDATFYYDSNDNFLIGGVPATMEEFEAELSVGDGVAGTYATNPDLVSTFNLDDQTPEAPDVTAVDDGEGSNEVTVDVSVVTGYSAGRDTFTLYQTPSTNDNGTAGVCTDDTYAPGGRTAVGTFTVADDEDDLTAGVQVTVPASPTGAADGCYLYQASATVDGEESELSTATPAAANTGQSTADTTAPDINSVTPNDINNGVGSTSELIVVFSEPVGDIDTTLWSVSPNAQPGIVIDVTAGEQDNDSGTRWILTLSQELTDAPTDIQYDVDTEAGAFTDLADNDNTPDTDTFDY